MHRPSTVLFLIALLSASGLAQADSINTFSFTGILATPIANQTLVTGQFVFDASVGSVPGFSFLTPVGLIDSNRYIAGPGVNLAMNGFSLLSIVFYENNNPLAPPALWLAFPGDTRNFSGGALYTGLVAARGFGYVPFSRVACTPENLACSPLADSLFANGYASLVTSTPEPTTFALFSCTLVFCLGRHSSGRARTDKGKK